MTYSSILSFFFLFYLFGQMSAIHRNVLGNNLELCSDSPLTGYHRTGLCETDENDDGLHLVCAQVTQEFLEFTRSQGNDLSTPSRYFPGLKPGDNWCLCVFRWYQAYTNGRAPPVVLAATHERTLDHLRQFNVGLTNLSESQAHTSRPAGSQQHQLKNGFRPHDLDSL